MACRLGIGEGTVGKWQSLVDPTEHPQCEGIENLRSRARIVAEPVGEIGMACLIVELDSLLEMLMGARKVTEIKAGVAGNAVSDQGLGAIGRAVASRKKSSAISRNGAGSERFKCPAQRP